VIVELAQDIAKLALIVAALYFVLGAYVRRGLPTWTGLLAKRRASLVVTLVLAVFAAKSARTR
jgi:hypothetical protein